MPLYVWSFRVPVRERCYRLVSSSRQPGEPEDWRYENLNLDGNHRTPLQLLLCWTGRDNFNGSTDSEIRENYSAPEDFNDELEARALRSRVLKANGET